MEANKSLDGTTLTYNYSDLGTVELEFYGGLVKYEWLDGPFKGLTGEDHDYKAREIGNSLYLIHWFESSRSSLITLVVNFKEDQVHSSALLNPTSEEEAVLFHYATIKKQHLVTP